MAIIVHKSINIYLQICVKFRGEKHSTVMHTTGSTYTLSGATNYGNPRQVMAATKLMKQFPTTPNDAVPPF